MSFRIVNRTRKTVMIPLSKTQVYRLRGGYVSPPFADNHPTSTDPGVEKFVMEGKISFITEQDYTKTKATLQNIAGTEVAKRESAMQVSVRKEKERVEAKLHNTKVKLQQEADRALKSGRGIDISTVALVPEEKLVAVNIPAEPPININRIDRTDINDMLITNTADASDPELTDLMKAAAEVDTRKRGKKGKKGRAAESPGTAADEASDSDTSEDEESTE